MLAADGSPLGPSWSSDRKLTMGGGGPSIRESRYTDKFSYHPSTDPVLCVAHPKIYIICKQLGHMKRPILLIQSCRISMIQGNED